MLYDSRNDVEFTCAVCELRKTNFGKLEWEDSKSVLTCLSCQLVAEGVEQCPQTNKEL